MSSSSRTSGAFVDARWSTSTSRSNSRAWAKVAACGPGRVDVGRAAQLRHDAGENRSVRADEGLLLARIESAHHLAKRLDDGRVGRPGLAQVEAGADGDPRAAIAGSRVPGLQQAGLADPGVAADQDGGRPAPRGSLQRLVERSELGATAHECRAGDTHHRRIIGRARRHAIAGADGRSSLGLIRSAPTAKEARDVDLVVFEGRLQRPPHRSRPATASLAPRRRSVAKAEPHRRPPRRRDGLDGQRAALPWTPGVFAAVSRRRIRSRRRGRAHSRSRSARWRSA